MEKLRPTETFFSFLVVSSEDESNLDANLAAHVNCQDRHIFDIERFPSRCNVAPK